MTLKCDSCSKTFPAAVSLFEHIQQSCLSFYKSHPLSWAKILSALGPDEEPSSNPRVTRKKTSLGSSRVSTPSPSSSASRETPPLATQMKTQSPVNKMNSNDNVVATTSRNDGPPLICKCEASFKTVLEFKEHLKTCTPGKEPPFCIMFRAQETEMGKPQKYVHLTVNDYFYGSLTGKDVKLKKISRRCNCYSCGKTLRNNIRFMSHLRHKVFNEWEKKGSKNEVLNICQHCYRQYDSPFLLQCHLENVHASVPAACSCRICELHFTSEKTFLFHMKDKHVHNETPYVCKVCMYKSSFYNDVIKHFREEHVDTTSLMCPFCLAVVHNSSSLLKHVIQHIKKGADCQRCRLKFINVKERAFHQQTDHCSQFIKAKMKKHKNLSKCQVYVRVSSFQMTQRQQQLQNAIAPASTLTSVSTVTEIVRESPHTSSLKRTRQINQTQPADESSPSKKAFRAPTGPKLPAYLCPLKRPVKVKEVGIPIDAGISVSAHKCAECKQSISLWNNSILKHFSNSFECRWCVFATCCEEAANQHVLREHADADLREQLLGKSEKTNAPVEAASLPDDESDITIMDTDVKTEPIDSFTDADLLPPQIEVQEDDDLKSLVGKKSSNKIQLKPRRKQSNPMKIADGNLLTPPSPKKVCKEKKVQTKSYEKEKGSQTFEAEFKEVNETETKTDNTRIVQKEFRRPGVKIQNKPKAFSRQRKILAPEGYFPDIDDDEGWAKYFKECEGTSGQLKVSQPLSTQILNPGATAQSSSSAQAFSRPASAVSVRDHPGKNKFILPANADQSGPKSSTTSGKTNVLHTGLALSNSGSNSSAANKKSARPVYQFQLVPKPGITPKPLTAGHPQPLNGLLNQVQNMLTQVPRTPVDLRCLEVTHSSLLVQWDAPPNCLVSHYKVVFQGSGAPTVQMLPPEQTLVRLVGLKSDTMYVVRVYTLCNKSVSQYAFLYQKTNKLRRKSDHTTTADDDDVVLVLDDNDSPLSQILPPPLTKAPVLGSMGISSVTPSMPSMSQAVTRVTKALTAENGVSKSQLSISKADSMLEIIQASNEQLAVLPSNNETLTEAGQTVYVVQPEAPEEDSSSTSVSLTLEEIACSSRELQNKEHLSNELKEHLDREKSEKMMLLSQLIGLKKKRVGKSKSNTSAANSASEASLPPTTLSENNTTNSDILTISLPDEREMTVDEPPAPDSIATQALLLSAMLDSNTKDTYDDIAVDMAEVNKETEGRNSTVIETEDNKIPISDTAVTSDKKPYSDSDIAESAANGEINGNKDDVVNGTLASSEQETAESNKVPATPASEPVTSAIIIIDNNRIEMDEASNCDAASEIKLKKSVDSDIFVKVSTATNGKKSAIFPETLSVDLTMVDTVQDSNTTINAMNNFEITDNTSVTGSTSNEEKCKTNSLGEDHTSKLDVSETEIEASAVVTDECEMEVNIVNVVSLRGSPNNEDILSMNNSDTQLSQDNIIEKSNVEDILMDPEEPVLSDSGICQSGTTVLTGADAAILPTNDALLSQEKPNIVEHSNPVLSPPDSCQLSVGQSGTIALAGPTFPEVEFEKNEIKKSEDAIFVLEGENKHNPTNDELADLPASNDDCSTSSDKFILLVTNREDEAMEDVPMIDLPPSPLPPNTEMIGHLINKMSQSGEVEMDSDEVIMIVDDSEKQNEKEEDDAIFVIEDENDDTPMCDADIDASAAQIQNTVRKDIIPLGSSVLSASDTSFETGPTLDDIKIIMHEDMPWL